MRIVINYQLLRECVVSKYIIHFLDGSVKDFDCLFGANLKGANLRRANLKGADLRKANLERADLIGANLKKTDLRRANLIGANLEGADLRRANLEGAALRRANLERADLIEANLEEADLIEANLEEADLIGANLIRADLYGTSIVSFQCGKHFAFYHEGYLKIGCEGNSLDYWIDNVDIIGNNNNYTETEINKYKLFINILKEI